MTWVKLDESMPDHPKVAGVSDRAFRLHVSALCYANRLLTDGHVPERIVQTLIPNGKRAASELVEAGVWDRAQGGFAIHDFLDYQPSKAEVIALREKRAEAGRIGGQRSKPPSKAEAKAQASALANAKQTPKQNRKQNRSPVPNPQPNKPSLGQSGLVAPELAAPVDHQIRNGSGLSEATQSAIVELLHDLPDVTDGTIGRLVKLAQHGAQPAHFHDARQGIAETKPRHPSRVACRIIEDHLP